MPGNTAIAFDHIYVFSKIGCMLDGTSMACSSNNQQ